MIATTAVVVLAPNVCEAQSRKGLTSALRITQLDFYGDLVRDSRMHPSWGTFDTLDGYENSLALQLRLGVDRFKTMFSSHQFLGERTLKIPLFGNRDTHVTSQTVWYNVASTSDYHLGPYVDGWKTVASRNTQFQFEGHYGVQLKMGW